MPRLIKNVREDFTTVHNGFVRDTNLGINARGLLLTMISLPDNWDFSIRGLAAILPDGKQKVQTALAELEKYGYLIRRQIVENGRFVDMEYIFSDEVMPEALEAYANKQSAKENAETKKTKKTTSSNPEIPYPENRYPEKQDTEKSDGNKINNNQILKDKDKIDMIDRTQPSASKSAPQPNEVEQYTEVVKENIEYDYLLSQYHPDELDEVVAVSNHMFSCTIGICT